MVLDELEHLADKDFGGTVKRPYLTSIYIAAKSPGTLSRSGRARRVG